MITWLRLAAVLSQSLLMLASAAFGQAGDSSGGMTCPRTAMSRSRRRCRA